MGIFKENFESKQQQIMQNPVQTNQSMNKVMTDNSRQQEKKESALTLKGLEQVSADELNIVTREGEKFTDINHDANSTDREVRRMAERKNASVLKVGQMLKNLDVNEKVLNQIVKSDDTVSMLNNLSEEEMTRQLEIVKEHAPQVYERLVKLERLISQMDENGNENSDVLKTARREKTQAENQWHHVQKMANDQMTS